MNGYNFTERVRKVLAMAREEAARLRHTYVGTEHELLGLIREGEGVAATVLQNLHVDLNDLEKSIHEMMKQGTAGQPTGPDLPYTSRAKKVLELAMSEARELNHAYVGTEHLLLGLIAEEKGIAAQSLEKHGITLDSARGEMLRILGPEPSRGESADRVEFVRGRYAKAARLTATAHLPPWMLFQEPLLSVIRHAYLSATARASDLPSQADVLEAIVRSAPAVSAALAKHGIEADALISDVRAAENPPS